MALTFRRLTPGLLDDMGCVLRGSWGASCWCMYPRLGNAEANRIGGKGRRAAMTAIARRKRAPGLMAYEGSEPVGWVAVGLAVSGVEGAGALAASRLCPCARSDGAVAAAGPATWLACGPAGGACGACAAAGVRPAAARAIAHANSFIFTPVTWVGDWATFKDDPC